MEKKSTILGGTLLLTAANLLLRLISIGFQAFLSRRLGASGLGLLQLISTVGVFVMLVGTSGIRVAAMYLSAEEFGHRRPGGVRAAMSECLRRGLAISSAVGVALFLSARPLAAVLLHDGRAALSLQVMGLLLPFSCLCGIMTGYFTACSRIKQLVAIEITERLFSIALTALLLVLWAKNDLRRACCAITLGSSVGCVLDFFLLYAIYRRNMRDAALPKEPLHLRKRLLKLCVPLALNDFLRAGLNTAEHLLIPFGLARFGGSFDDAMAAYGTIHAMVFPILMFPAVILYSVSDLLVPELSRSRAMERRVRIADLADKCIRMEMLFASAVTGFLFLNAHQLGVLLFDSASAGHYLRVFAPMALMLYLDAIVDGMLKGLAEQVSCVRYNTFTSLLDVLFLLVLLPRWGIGGYVFSFAVTHAVNLYLSLRRLLKTAAHRPALSDFFCPLLSLLAALLPPLLLKVGSSAAKNAVFLLLLTAFYLLTGAFRSRDWHWLRQVLRRSLGRQDVPTRAAAAPRRK